MMEGCEWWRVECGGRTSRSLSCWLQGLADHTFGFPVVSPVTAARGSDGGEGWFCCHQLLQWREAMVFLLMAVTLHHSVVQSVWAILPWPQLASMAAGHIASQC